MCIRDRFDPIPRHLPRYTDTPVRRFVLSLFPPLFPAFPSVGTGHEGQVHKPSARSPAYTPFRFAVALFFFAVCVHGYLRSGTLNFYLNESITFCNSSLFTLLLYNGLSELS